MTVRRIAPTLLGGLVIVLTIAVGLWFAGRTQAPPPATTVAGHEAPAVGHVDEVAAAVLTVEVDDAREAAREALKEATGDDCGVAFFASILWTEEKAAHLDEQIAAAGVESGWIKEGMWWLGAPEDFAEALGASALFADETGDMWLMHEKDGKPYAGQLYKLESAAGKTVWTTVNRLSECPPDQ